GGVSGLHQRNGFGDRNRLRLRAGLNSQVSPNLLANPKLDVLALQLLESIGLGADCIRARKQLRGVVLPGVIRGEGSCDTSVFVDDCYRGTRYNPATLVCNRAENASVTAL